MNKPREWWIQFNFYNSTEDFVYDADETKDIDKDAGEVVHVIEYSAYEDVCKALDQVERKLYDVDMPKEIFELKAKLAIATEALDAIRVAVEGHTTRAPLWRMASAALEKLK